MNIFIIFVVLTITSYENTTNLKTPLASCNFILSAGVGQPSCQGAFNFMKPYENLSLEDMPGEVWKDIPGYEGYYSASNLGRIKSLKKTIKNNRGIFHHRKERILKQTIDTTGYLRIELCANGKQTMKNSHRMIISSLLGESDKQVDHINSNKTDNCIENLEYVTPRENIQRSHILRNTNKLPMGVRKIGNKYYACIGYKKKDGTHTSGFLGVFDTPEEASNKYLIACNDLDNLDKYLVKSNYSIYGKGIRKRPKTGKFELTINKVYIGTYNTFEEVEKAKYLYLNERKND